MWDPTSKRISDIIGSHIESLSTEKVWRLMSVLLKRCVAAKYFLCGKESRFLIKYQEPFLSHELTLQAPRGYIRVGKDWAPVTVLPHVRIPRFLINYQEP